jgi:hypothetical protein
MDGTEETDALFVVSAVTIINSKQLIPVRIAMWLGANLLAVSQKMTFMLITYSCDFV